MSRKLTNSGFVVLGIGVVLMIIGFILFISVFFSVANQMESPQIPGFGPHMGFEQPRTIPFQNAVVGIILVGVGGLMVKAGLGMSVVGSADKIADWGRSIIHGKSEPQQNAQVSSSATCPNCNESVSTKAKFCSHCGNKLQ
ncbi:MAG: zinc ribbon domain-containing protein [Firmicutes bacterium]|nr:zinc ribbon domain-containing protein [Bacillota bacterium]